MGRYTSEERTTPEKAWSKGAPCAPPRDRFILLERLDRFECLERFDRLERLDRFVQRFIRRVMSTKKEENYEGS